MKTVKNLFKKFMFVTLAVTMITPTVLSSLGTVTAYASDETVVAQEIVETETAQPEDVIVEDATEESSEDIEEVIEEVETEEVISGEPIEGVTEETTSEQTEETTAVQEGFDQYADINIGSNSYVRLHVTAPAGVFPEGTKIVVSTTDEEEQEAAIAAVKEKRSENKIAVSSIVLDIKAVDEEGNEVQPDTANGKVKITIGTVDEDGFAKASSEAVKAAFVNQSDTVYTSEELEKIDFSVASDKIKLNVYHIEEDESATDLNAVIASDEDNMPEAQKIVSAETDGFSYYVIDVTAECDMEALNSAAMKVLEEELENKAANAVETDVYVDSYYDNISVNIRWNDNTGNTAYDPQNLVDRPSASDINPENYKLFFAFVDEYGAESEYFVFNENKSKIGLTDDAKLNFTENRTYYSITPDTALPSAIVNVHYNDKGELVEEYKEVVYYLMQEDNAVPNGYLRSDEDQWHQLGGGKPFIYTVQTKYGAGVEWVDNDNSYGSRVDTATVASNFKIYRYLGEGTTPEEVTNNNNVVVADNGDGTYSVSLTNLPNYNSDGAEYTYFLNLGNVDATQTADTLPGDFYSPLYTNVDWYQHNVTDLYNDGVVQERLTNYTNFTYTSTWSDGKDPDTELSSRPQCRVYLYSIPESVIKDSTSVAEIASQASPVDGTAAKSVAKKNETVEIVPEKILNVYDSEGARIVYFGLEVGVTGDYVEGVDNTTATSASWVTDDAKNKLDTYKSVYLDKNGNNYPKYVLNNGVIDHALTSNVYVNATVTIEATALQSSLEDAKVQLALQKWDAENEEWVAVTNADRSKPDPDIAGDTPITATLTGFIAEDLTKATTSPALPKYDDNGEVIHYRYIETSLAINDGTPNTLTWNNSEKSPAKTNKYTADEVSVGKYAPGVGENVDMFVTGNETVNGYTSNIINRINAPTDVDITKTWTVTVVNEDGTRTTTNVSGDEEWMDGVYIAVKITREEDGKTSYTSEYQINDNTLRDRDGNPVQDVFMNINDLTAGGNAWNKVVENLERFTPDGTEYTYSVEEYDVVDPKGTQWATDIITKKQNDIYKDDMTLQELAVFISNTIGPDDGFEIVAEKKWEDGGDVDSRKSTWVGLYKISTGQLLGIYELNVQNNWYVRAGVDENTTDINGQSIGDLGEYNDYVFLEVGVGATGPSADTEYNNTGEAKEYGTWTAEDLEEYFNAVRAGALTGEVLPKDTTQEYQYHVRGEYNKSQLWTEKHPEYAYIFTNTRYADMSVNMTKTWKDGGLRRISEFNLTRTDVNGNTETILKFLMPQNKEVETVTISDDTFTYKITDNGTSSKVDVQGLAKYDVDGYPYTYNFKETYIYEDGTITGGTSVEGYTSKNPIHNGSATVSTDTYSCAMNLQNVVYGANFHDGDVYTYSATNNLTGSYDLTANKVWYDLGANDPDVERPGIYYSIYRVSSKVLDGIAYNDTMSVKDYIESDSFNTEDFAAKMSEIAPTLSKSQISSIDSDRFWDANVNTWVWKVDIGNVAKYDSNGYYYVYFAKEGGNGSTYSAYYGNGSADSMPLVTTGSSTTVKDVYDIYTAEGKKYEENTYLILSDGVHSKNNDPGQYYSKTVVNIHQSKEYISGRKVWKLPDGWTVDDTHMPEVEFQLYRSTTAMKDAEGVNLDDYWLDKFTVWKNSTNAEYILTYYVNAREGVDEITKFGSYKYKLTKDKAGNDLPKYDEYGNKYYYYIIESSLLKGYNASETTYVSSNYTTTNIYKVEDAYVKIYGEKSWAINNDKRFPTSLELTQLSPVTVTLYAQPWDHENDVAAGDPIVIATKKLDPKNSTDGKISFTFEAPDKAIGDGDNKNKIPYYGPNGEPFEFYIQETYVNGYSEYLSVNGKSNLNGTSNTEHINLVVESEDTNTKTYSNKNAETDNTAKFSNTYNGGNTEFSITKNWGDEYVDNNAYRPNVLNVTVGRKSYNPATGKTETDTDFNLVVSITKNQTGNTETTEGYVITTNGKDAVNKWTGKVEKLTKYNPLGYTYVYFIVNENAVVDGTTYTATAVGDKLGYYDLVAKTSDILSNELDDSTDVSFKKQWQYQDGSTTRNITWTVFNQLRTMGGVPDTVQYLLQRSTDGTTWTNVPAAYAETRKTTTVDGKTVLGQTSDLKNMTQTQYNNGALNLSLSWSQLPKVEVTTKNPYTYRITEIMTWPDGTVTKTADYITGQTGTMTSTAEAITATIAAQNANGNVAITANNRFDTQKVRLAKLWNDENDYDNTRPSSIKLTIKSKTTGKTITKELKALTGSTDHTYYSDYIYLPSKNIKPFTTANYEISETLVFNGNGSGNYVQNPAAPGFEVVTFTNTDPETYAFKLTNTPTDERKLIEIDAKKVWAGETQWDKENVRPKTTFSLEYKERESGEWVPLTDTTIVNFIKPGTTQAAIYTYDPAVDGIDKVEYTYQWKNLYKYWYNNQTDGVPEKIEYRVIETIETTDRLNSYVASPAGGIISYAIADKDTDNEKYDGTVTNTLSTTNVPVKKNWLDGTKSIPSSTTSLSSISVANLVNLKAIPEYIRFKLQYSVDGGTTYQDYMVGTGADATVKTYDFKSVDLAGGTACKATALPEYDNLGKEISYKLIETQIKYVGGDWQNAGYGITLTEQAFTNGTTQVVFNNDIKTTNAKVVKTWLDESNREGLENTVYVQLYRDGVAYGDPAQLTKANGYKYEWVDLPYYTNDATAANKTESVYTLKEVGIGSATAFNATYTTYYTKGEGGRQASETAYTIKGSDTDDHEIGITNIYEPERGYITATKKYASDEAWKLITRQGEVKVHLEYYNATTKKWTTVTKQALDSDNLYPDNGVYTTSDVEQTITITVDGNVSSTAKWENLPVYYNHNRTNKVQYRVVETAIKDYKVSYSSSSVTLDNEKNNVQQEKKITVTNTLQTTSIEVAKKWTADDVELTKEWVELLVELDALPKQLNLLVQYYDTQTNSWAPVPSIGDSSHRGEVTFNTVNNFNGLTIDAKLPQYDNAGNLIRYRVRETGAVYASDEVIHVSGSDEDTLGYLTVTQAGETTWDGTTTKPKFSFTNAYESGPLGVYKKWLDEENRDNVRLTSIDVELTGSGDAGKLTTTLNAENEWKYTWLYLPIYDHDGDEKVTYTVTEVTPYAKGETAYYEVDCVPESAQMSAANDGDAPSIEVDVENSHAPDRGSVTAKKIWEDENNKYNTRPTDSEVELKLQYYDTTVKDYVDVVKVDESKVTKDGKAIPYVGDDMPVAYTTSEVTQTVNGLEGENAKTAAWDNLPVRYNGAPITYRVTEVGMDEDAGTYGGYDVSIDAEAVTVTVGTSTNVDVTNELQQTSLKLEKKWENDPFEELTRPDSITFKIEYRVEGEDDPHPLADVIAAEGFTTTDSSGYVIMRHDADGNWNTIVFNGLPVKNAEGKAYSYEVTEVTMNKDQDIYTPGDKSSYTASVVVNHKDDGTWEAVATNTLNYSHIDAEKTWVDENNRDVVRPNTITFTLYASSTLIGEKTKVDEQTVSEENGKWYYYWDKLPIKDLAGNAIKYTVEETEVTYYDTTYTGNGTVIEGGNASVEVTNKHIPERGIITANKKWTDEDNLYGTRTENDEVYVALQYKNGNSWEFVPAEVTLTDGIYAGTEIAYTTSALVQVVDGDTKTAKWENLPVYYNNNGTKTNVQYKVVEVKQVDNNYVEKTVDGYTVTVSPETTTLPAETADPVPVNVEIENTLDKTSLTIEKTWAENGGSLDNRPTTIKFLVEYKVGDGAWTKMPKSLVTTIDENGYISISGTTDKATWSREIKGLPVKNSDGEEFSYRVSEAVLVYADKTITANGTFSGTTWTGTAGAYAGTASIAKDGTTWKATASNGLDVASVKAIKIWDDEDDRDGGRVESITFTLYRDGTQYGDPVTLTAADADADDENKWSYTWNNVPTMNEAGTADAQYTVKETITYAEGATVTYVAKYTGTNGTATEDYSAASCTTEDGENEIEVRNIYVPEKGSVSVTKAWEDIDNYFELRPDSIYVKLQYKLEGDTAWSEVTVAALDTTNNTYPDGGVYTTTASAKTGMALVELTAPSYTGITWANLPLTADGKSVIYRVIETDEDGAELTKVGAYTIEVSDPEGVTLEDATDHKSAQTITNTLELTALEVNKTWVDETLDTIKRPVSISFMVETKSTGDWTPFTSADETVKDGILVVTGSAQDDQWTKRVSNIPLLDEDGNEYHYRVSEYVIKYSDGTETSSENGQFTDNDTKWSADNLGPYTAETSIAYDDDNVTFTVTAKNTLVVAELDVEKIWNDAENRDGVRTDDVTVALHRVDKVDGSDKDSVVDTQKLNKDNNWKYAWKNLPVYTTDGSTPSKYYVVETAVSEYTTAYTPADNVTLDTTAATEISVTNTYVPKTLSFDAEKIWNDNDNYYHLRDTEVVLTLQYSLDGGTTWVDSTADDSIITPNTAIADRPEPKDDKGTVIYSASDNSQTITGSADANTWTKATWSDLSAYVLVDGKSTKVTYRAVELDEDKVEGYTVIESSNVDIDTVSTAAATTVQVENKLEDYVDLGVHKNWTLSDDILDKNLVLPDSILVKLQFSTDNGTTWHDVEKNGSVSLTASLTAENNWSAIFNQHLRTNYKYRAVEVSMTWGDKTVYVKDATGAVVLAEVGKAGSFDYEAETTYDAEKKHYQAELTNSLPETEISVTKTWKDEDNRDSLRKEITVNLYRDIPAGTADKSAYKIATGTLTEENGWTVTWKNLPMYQNGSDSVKSVYTVEEIQNEKYEDPVYDSATVEIGDDGTAAFDITNIYYPAKGSVKATKIWEDYSDHYGDRPETIYLTLKYKLHSDDEFAPVLNEDGQLEDVADVLYRDGKVRTTSEVTQEITTTSGDKQEAKWIDLPITAKDEDGKSCVVIYKVFETDKDGKDIVGANEDKDATLPNYEITYSSEDGDVLVADEEGVISAEQEITNTLVETNLTIKKIWIGDDAVYGANGETASELVRPIEITFLVEVSKDGGNTWAHLNQAQAKADSDDDADDSASAGDFKAAKDAEEPEEPEVPENPEDPDEEAPEATVITDGFVTMKGNAKDGWNDIFVDKLPVYAVDGTEYQYRVREYSITIGGKTILCTDGEGVVADIVGAYDGITTIEVDADHVWTVTAENTLPVGTLTVEKKWNDAADRDGIRPGSITFELHRIDVIDDETTDEAIDTVTITPDEDGNWPTYTWNNLPLYTSDGFEFAEYYVVETSVDGYTTTYAVSINGDEDEETKILVTNTHEPELFEIKAVKIWDDYDNRYEKRDKDVTFTLEYSLDGGQTFTQVEKLAVEDRPSPAEDDGTKVWTSSDPTQTIKAGENGNTMTNNTWVGFDWKDLPGFALNSEGVSVEITYRIVEKTLSNEYYTCTGDCKIKYSDAKEGFAEGSINNKMTTVPKTGERSNYLSWMLMMIASIAVGGLGFGFFFKKRKDEE